MDEDHLNAAAVPEANRYDVVVIGGAFAGAAAATLIRRWCPDHRILIAERTPRFSRKVGEATVEVSALFLTRVLGLSQELARAHLPKHGLRFWFDNGLGPRLDQMDELGPNRLPGMHSFHMDRSVLDQTLLDKAGEAGVEIARPVRVDKVEMDWPRSTLTLTPDPTADPAAKSRTVTARWVIDASGRQRFLGRRMGLIQKIKQHPIAAAWGRWAGVADLDGPGVLGPDPRSPRLPPLSPSRGLSTNHFCGHGWWCWVIPLAGGQTSIGLVYDKRLFDMPGEGKPRDRYEAFVRAQPGLCELLKDAAIVADDFLAYKDLPYRATRYAAPGWALVGDAAAFLDPLYSSGLDHAAFSTYATARLIERDLKGELDPQALTHALDSHNASFARSYDRWLAAVYLDKYELLGDAQLVSASYFLDIGTYYLGVVGAVYREVEAFSQPVLGNEALRARIAWRSMAALKGRMVRLARKRRALGIAGGGTAKGAMAGGGYGEGGMPRRSGPWRQYPTRFALGATTARLITRGLALWLKAELQTLTHRLRHPRGTKKGGENRD